MLLYRSETAETNASLKQDRSNRIRTLIGNHHGKSVRIRISAATFQQAHGCAPKLADSAGTLIFLALGEKLF